MAKRLGSALHAGQAHAELAQGEEPAHGRGGDRRLHAGTGNRDVHLRRAAWSGVPDGDGLRFAGGVGTGFNQRARST